MSASTLHLRIPSELADRLRRELARSVHREESIASLALGILDGATGDNWIGEALCRASVAREQGAAMADRAREARGAARLLRSVAARLDAEADNMERITGARSPDQAARLRELAKTRATRGEGDDHE
mgnify:CR=1 FL=1